MPVIRPDTSDLPTTGLRNIRIVYIGQISTPDTLNNVYCPASAADACSRCCRRYEPGPEADIRSILKV